MPRTYFALIFLSLIRLCEAVEAAPEAAGEPDIFVYFADASVTEKLHKIIRDFCMRLVFSCKNKYQSTGELCFRILICG